MRRKKRGLIRETDIKKIKLKIMLIIILVGITFIPSNCYANNGINNNKDEIYKQQEEYEVKEFIKNAKKYTGKLLDEISIEDILCNAIEGKVDNSTLGKRIIKLFGEEFATSFKTIGNILIIIVIHSVLKAISENLENQGVSKLIFYVQYILIITIIMTNFSNILLMVQDTITNLVAFMNLLVPLLITLMVSTGSIVTSGIIEPIVLFMISFIGNIVENIIIPLIMIFTSLVIISNLSEQVKIDKINKILKSGILWALIITLTIFVGVISLEGTLSSSVDRDNFQDS